jgi:hypothetical protein
MPSQEVAHISPTEVTPELGKGALDTWRPSQPYGGRLDKTGTYAGCGSGGEAGGKPGVAGVHTNQRLSLSKPWGGPRKIGQGFKPDPGNLAVRHYRGASRNVRHGETVTPSCNRKSGNGNPSPTAGRARSLSQPSASFEARSAPSSYPTSSSGSTQSRRACLTTAQPGLGTPETGHIRSHSGQFSPIRTQPASPSSTRDYLWS